MKIDEGNGQCQMVRLHKTELKNRIMLARCGLCLIATLAKMIQKIYSSCNRRTKNSVMMMMMMMIKLA